MTKRERYLAALHQEAVDELVWAPNFDYWLQVNRAEGTMPEQFKEMSRNDIVRAIGGSIWNRAGGMRRIYDPSVKVTRFAKGSDQILQYETPVGTVFEVHAITEGEHRSRAVTHHLIQEITDLKVVQYLAEATDFEAPVEATIQALRETGEDGVVLNGDFCVPFIQFAKNDVGYGEAFYLWTDYREEVDHLISTYFELFLKGYRLMAKGAADVIATGDNMDGLMISPSIFKEYALPFYAEAKKITKAANKLLEVHWCGRTDTLLEYLPSSGVDVVEAVVTAPMSGITLTEALEKLDGKVVLQGGIPSVLVCKEGCDDAAFDRYLVETILPLKGHKGFILGMSDNVPPNADFGRVQRIAAAIR